LIVSLERLKESLRQSNDENLALKEQYNIEKNRNFKLQEQLTAYAAEIEKHYEDEKLEIEKQELQNNIDALWTQIHETEEKEKKEKELFLQKEKDLKRQRDLELLKQKEEMENLNILKENEIKRLNEEISRRPQTKFVDSETGPSMHEKIRLYINEHVDSKIHYHLNSTLNNNITPTLKKIEARLQQLEDNSPNNRIIQDAVEKESKFLNKKFAEELAKKTGEFHNQLTFEFEKLTKKLQIEGQAKAHDINQLLKQKKEFPINQSTNQSINQSNIQSINHSTKQSQNQSNSKSQNQSINHSTKQSQNQSNSKSQSQSDSKLHIRSISEVDLVVGKNTNNNNNNSNRQFKHTWDVGTLVIGDSIKDSSCNVLFVSEYFNPSKYLNYDQRMSYAEWDLQKSYNTYGNTTKVTFNEEFFEKRKKEKEEKLLN